VGVAYNNGRVLSHEGNKVKISGVGRRVGGILIREGVRRNRLQKWRAASLNTGFSRIFDFGGPSKDGGPPSFDGHINRCEPNKKTFYLHQLVYIFFLGGTL
jgi:hypothetical protein